MSCNLPVEDSFAKHVVNDELQLGIHVCT